MPRQLEANLVQVVVSGHRVDPDDESPLAERYNLPSKGRGHKCFLEVSPIRALSCCCVPTKCCTHVTPCLPICSSPDHHCRRKRRRLQEPPAATIVAAESHGGWRERSIPPPKNAGICQLVGEAVASNKYRNSTASSQRPGSRHSTHCPVAHDKQKQRFHRDDVSCEHHPT